MPHQWIVLCFAGFLDASLGYPDWLYRRIRHPVVWMGACITRLDRQFNSVRFSPHMRCGLGVLAMALLLACTLAVALPIHLLPAGPLQAIGIAMLLAQRDLYEHVEEVYAALRRDNLPEARRCVSRIVGRDVAGLDESGVCRAAIESLAESFCDGVVAPISWAACFGLPGIACYKAINTADSMIGHKDEQYGAFGWAAARLDDVANWIPARLSGLLIAVAARSGQAWEIMRRDARQHASPNAGWPEAAMAGALGLRLGGPQCYDGVEHEAAFMSDGTPDATPVHLRRALRLYVTACGLLWATLLWAGLAIAAFR